MRKITKRSVECFKHGVKFKSDNTEVKISKEHNSSNFFLFGYCIASFKTNQNQLVLDDCGYETVTTKERLNGILSEFNLPYYISQQKYKWYLFKTDSHERIEWSGQKTFEVNQ